MKEKKTHTEPSNSTGSHIIYFGDPFKQKRIAHGLEDLTRQVIELLNKGMKHLDIHVIT